MRFTIFSDDLRADDTHTNFHVKLSFDYNGTDTWNRFRVVGHSLQLKSAGAWADSNTEYLIEIGGLAISNNYQTYSSTSTARSSIVHLASLKPSSLPSPWVKIAPYDGGLQDLHIRLLGKTTEGTTTNLPLNSDNSPDTNGQYGFAIIILEFK